MNNKYVCIVGSRMFMFQSYGYFSFTPTWYEKTYYTPLFYAPLQRRAQRAHARSFSSKHPAVWNVSLKDPFSAQQPR